MTKAEEIAMFRQFVEGLPADSYLATILAGMAEEVERMIQADWAYPLAEALQTASMRALLAELEAGKQRERADRLEAEWRRLKERELQLRAQLQFAEHELAALRD
jgi:hypothetical protein